MEWEDPSSMKNVEKMVQTGKYAGQLVFDRFGKFDTIYFKVGKVE